MRPKGVGPRMGRGQRNSYRGRPVPFLLSSSSTNKKSAPSSIPHSPLEEAFDPPFTQTVLPPTEVDTKLPLPNATPTTDLQPILSSPWHENAPKALEAPFSSKLPLFRGPTAATEELERQKHDRGSEEPALSTSLSPPPEMSLSDEHSHTPLKVPNWIKSLEEELDGLLFVVLRDGRKLTGFLRTFDQYGNLMLEAVCEKLIVGQYYADLPLGCLIVRGENIVLFGAVDETKPIPLIEKSLSDILCLQQTLKADLNLSDNLEDSLVAKQSTDSWDEDI